MPEKLKPSYVILSEGLADKKLLQRLTSHWLPDLEFSFPFPNDSFYSSSQFSLMISALRADAIGFASLKGIIVVADSCDSPDATFASIQQQLTTANASVVPKKIGEIGSAGEQGPPIAALTVPSKTESGGLESLYWADLAQRNAALSVNVETFLNSAPSIVSSWNAEKQAKARFASMVATSHRDDPSRAASAAFRAPPTVHIESPVFEPFAIELRGVCNAMRPPDGL